MNRHGLGLSGGRGRLDNNNLAWWSREVASAKTAPSIPNTIWAPPIIPSFNLPVPVRRQLSLPTIRTYTENVDLSTHSRSLTFANSIQSIQFLHCHETHGT